MTTICPQPPQNNNFFSENILGKFKKSLKVVTLGGLTLAAIGAANLVATQAQAQSNFLSDTPVIDKVAVTAIPPRIGDDGTLTAKPGETLQINMRVRNSSTEPLNVQTTARDFIVGEDGETPVPVTDQVNHRWSLASWLTASPEFQKLGPDQIGTVAVIINVPKDALPGGHYAMVTHQPVDENTVNAAATNALSLPADGSVPVIGGSAARVSQRVGTLLYVLVDGPINEEAYIRDFTLPNFTELGPVPFALNIDNQSDIHIRPQVTVKISNIFGQTVETIQLEPKNIFPLNTRSFSGIWDRVWGAGLYKATAEASFGSSGQLITTHQYFWLFPLTLILAFIIFILVAIALVIVIRRHMLHRENDDKERLEMLEKKLADIEQEKLQQFE
jgi:hypothetical protein